MRILRPIIQILASSVINTGQHLARNDIVTTQAISHKNTRTTECGVKNMREKAFCRLGIASRLQQDIQDQTLTVNRPPQIVPVSINGYKDLIQVPFISRFPPPLTHLLGKVRSKSITPAANGLVAHDNSTLRQKQFDIAKAERQSEIQPDGILNDARRETEAFEEIL